jgi:serine/threonine protein kinase
VAEQPRVSRSAAQSLRVAANEAMGTTVSGTLMANIFHSPASGAMQRESIGKYRLLKELDSNRPGSLYAAEEPHTRRVVAVKLPLLPRECRQAFHDEARRLTRLDHENIAPILDVGDANGECFLVTELLKGESLQDRLKRERRLPLKESVRIAREMAAGLAYVHAHGLVHRDICPANVWLEPFGRVRLLGFGQATGGDLNSLLGPIDGVGTAGYLSPEQAAGEAISTSSDLFSLGCVLYQMTTGERPFRGESCAALFRSVVFEQPASVRQVNPDVPAEIDELVTALMAKMPAGRPASAQEVEDRLMKWLDPSAPKSRALFRPAPLNYPASKRILDALEFLKNPVVTAPTAVRGPGIPFAKVMSPKNRRWLVDVIAAIVLLAGAAGLYLWWRSSTDPEFYSTPAQIEPSSPGNLNR